MDDKKQDIEDLDGLKKEVQLERSRTIVGYGLANWTAKLGMILSGGLATYYLFNEKYDSSMSSMIWLSLAATSGGVAYYIGKRRKDRLSKLNQLENLIEQEKMNLNNK